MRDLSFFFTAVTAVLGLVLLSAGCGGSDEEEQAAADGGAGPRSSQQPGKADREPAPPVDLEALMVGFWAPDEEHMQQELTRELAGNPSADTLGPMIESIVASMAVEIPRKGEIVVYRMGKRYSSLYTLTETDSASKTLSMRITEDGEVREGRAVIGGDTLTLHNGEKTLKLKRIDEDTFRTRIENVRIPIPPQPQGEQTPSPGPPPAE